MATAPIKRALIAAAIVAAAAECAVVYQQWPPPPLKVCASVELGELLAAAKKAEADLHQARARLRTDPDETTPKLVMGAESASAAAWNAVTDYKQRALERQKARGAAARDGACS
jgi:hypothetical protein